MLYLPDSDVQYRLDNWQALLDPVEPVNWENDLLQGLRWWGLAAPSLQGQTLWRALVGGDATLANGPQWSARAFQGGWGSMRFDGASAGQSAQLPLSLTAQYTMRARMRVADTLGSYRQLVGQDSYHQILANGAQLEIWTNSDTGGTLTHAIAADVDYDVCLVRHGDSITNGLKLYVNGELSGAVNTGTFFTLTGGFWLGCQANTPSRVWNGWIDDAMVFNRPLSAGDVRSLYLAGLTAYPTQLNWRRPATRYFAFPGAGGGGTTYSGDWLSAPIIGGYLIK